MIKSFISLYIPTRIDGLDKRWIIYVSTDWILELLTNKLRFEKKYLVGLFGGGGGGGTWLAADKQEHCLIGWRQTLTSSPANHIRFLLVRANKFAKWKTGLNLVLFVITGYYKWEFLYVRYLRQVHLPAGSNSIHEAFVQIEVLLFHVCMLDSVDTNVSYCYSKVAFNQLILYYKTARRGSTTQRVNHYDFVALHSMWRIFLKG